MLTVFTYFIILLVIVMGLVAIRHPGVMAALMWSMFALEQLLQRGNEFLMEYKSGVNIGLTVLAALCVANALRMGRYRGFRIPREAVAMLGLLTMAGLSYLWAVSPKDLEEQVWKYLPYLAAFSLITPLLATDDRQMRLALNITVFYGGIILLGHALSNYGSRGMIIDSMWGKRLEGNPLAVATYAGYVGICGIFSVPGQRPSLVALIRFGVLLLAGWIIVRSGSRGQLLGLAAVCVVWLPITTRATFKRSTVVALLMSIGLILAGIYLVDRFEWSGRWSWQKIVEAREGRWEMATNLMAYWADAGPMRWLFGLGNSAAWAIVGFYPHNAPIEVMCEEGLVGLGIYALFIGSAVTGGTNLMFNQGLSISSRNNLGILLAMFSFEFILTLKEGSLLGNSMFFCLGCSIGILNMVYRRQLQMARAQQQLRPQSRDAGFRSLPGATPSTLPPGSWHPGNSR